MKWLVVVALVALNASACGNDNGAEIPCTDEEFWDQVNEVCVPRYRDQNSDSNAMSADAGMDMQDDEPDMAAEPDMTEPDMPMFGGECDKDRDGVRSIECGGDDCDDENSQRSPLIPEFCDEVDNDCDDVNNEGVQCTFYAHSGTTLYAVDPFEKSVTEIGTDLPNLLDIDTHPNGTLLGVSYDGLHEFDDIRNSWFMVGEYQNNDITDPNGMAIDSSGRVFVTSQDKIFELDIIDGRATLLGDLGSNADGADYYSSGDCVVNKRDSLYMTSKHDEAEDYLLLVNRDNGMASEVGPIGFQKVFALTAAWGKLYGLTDSAQLIEIDSMTGSGTLVHQFEQEGLRFFGAASTPAR